MVSTLSHTHSNSSRSEKKEGEMSAFVGRMRFHTQSNGVPLRVTSRGAETCQRRFVTHLVLQVWFCNGKAFSVLFIEVKSGGNATTNTGAARTLPSAWKVLVEQLAPGRAFRKLLCCNL